MSTGPVISARAAFARGVSRQFPVPACSLDVDDLDRLFRLLHQKASEAADKEVASLQQQPGQTVQQYDQAKDTLRTLLNLVVRVQGSDGEWIVANTADPIREESLPISTTTIQFDSSFAYRGMFNNKSPNNSFIVTLDFKRTDILDLTNTVVASGSNQSTVAVSGTDVTWVNAVTQEQRAFFEARHARRAWVHSRFAYDALVLVIGFPVSLNVVFHIDKILKPALKLPDALFVAVYVYLVLLVLLGFRLLFNYVKWVFPKVEGPARRHGSPGLHKGIITAVALALIVRAVTSLLWILGIHLH